MVAHCLQAVLRFTQSGNNASPFGRITTMARPSRFWSRVNKTETCWLWTGAQTGQFVKYGNAKYQGRTQGAHRVAYQLVKGPIPEGFQIDHLCFVPLCVNPDHLEAVPRDENDRRRRNRRTHCPQGHEYTESNSLIDTRGYRLCRICRNKTDAAGKRRRRANQEEK